MWMIYFSCRNFSSGWVWGISCIPLHWIPLLLLHQTNWEFIFSFCREGPWFALLLLPNWPTGESWVNRLAQEQEGSKEINVTVSVNIHKSSFSYSVKAAYAHSQCCRLLKAPFCNLGFRLCPSSHKQVHLLDIMQICNCSWEQGRFFSLLFTLCGV